MALAIALGGTVSASDSRTGHGASDEQRQQLEAIARDTWSFFDADTDHRTHLPLDNIGFNGAPALLNAMNFKFFYDPGVPGKPQMTDGQMFGGYIADTGPAGFHYGLLNTETRIAAYIGIGTHRMPGDVWWRTFKASRAELSSRSGVRRRTRGWLSERSRTRTRRVG